MKLTHVGSLPFKDLDQALDFTFQFDLPVLPSLPQVDSNFFMDKEIFSFTQSTQEDFIPHGEKLFFKRLKGQFKYQNIGPISFTHTQKKYDFNSSLKILGNLYSKLFKRWSDKDFIFIFDEPLYFMASDDEKRAAIGFYQNLMEMFPKIQFGLHCCSKLNRLDLEKLSFFNYLNIDLHLYQSSDIPSDQENVFKMAAVLDFKDLADINEDLQDKVVTYCQFLTPTCGLALTNEANINSIFNELEKLKTKYCSRS